MKRKNEKRTDTLEGSGKPSSFIGDGNPPIGIAKGITKFFFSTKPLGRLAKATTVPRFTGLYWVLLDYTELNWVLQGFTEFS